jgi:transcriptional regulator with XRE-family HTH domain
MTLQTVADRLHISIATLSRMETGIYGVNDERLAQLARVYGISPVELSSHPDDQRRAHQLHRLLAATRMMTAADVASLADLAERIGAKG